MTRKWFRFVAILGLAAVVLPLTGCLLEGPEKPQDYYPYIRVQPDYALEAPPTGYLYQLWSLQITPTSDTSFAVGFIPLARFNWDPTLYLAKAEDGTILPLTTSPGMDMGWNLAETFALLMTIEPIDDPHPDAPDGPVLMVNNVNAVNPTTTSLLSTPYLALIVGADQGGGFPSPQYTLLSQSNKKGHTGADWQDGSEGLGIWFAVPSIGSRTIYDYDHPFDVAQQVFVPPAPDSPYVYVVWSNIAYPESSWSNFGKVFDYIETDISFVDGVPQHPDTTKHSLGSSSIHLGEDPVYIDGELVGYRYISPSGLDTCVLRIDRPNQTRCNRDTFDSLVFNEVVRTPRQFVLTTGDTSVVGTLRTLPDFEELNQNPQYVGLFAGWEYEAWVVFDEASGIKPLSMGRFKSGHGLDDSNLYTYTDSRFDQNFHFPGEDFLQNLAQHDSRLPSPLNVITDGLAKKIWVTVEPVRELDWAPDDPNTQLIFCSAWLPTAASWQSTGGAFPVSARSMALMNVDPGPESLNEGHRLPGLTVYFNRVPTTSE